MPLIDTQKYTLYKVIPLPVKQSLGNSTNTFAYIWPQHPYLAVNTHSHLYVPMNSNTLAECKAIRNLRICKNTEPVREINENSCFELNAIIVNPIINLASCNLKIIQLRQTYWVRLHAKNAWAFSTLSSE